MLMASAAARLRSSPCNPRTNPKRKRRVSPEPSAYRNSPPRVVPSPPTLAELVQGPQKPKSKFRDLLERLIICSAAEVNATGRDGMSALHHAVLCGEEACTKALIAFGADINTQNDFEMTPLDMALQNPQGEHLVPLLVSIGCERGEVMKHLTQLQRLARTPLSHACGYRSVPPAPPTSARSVCKHSPFTPLINLSKLESTDLETLSRRRQNLKELRLDGSPAATRNAEELSRVLEREIKGRLELSESMRGGDEPFALTLQQQEISKFKSKSRQSLSSAAIAVRSDALPSPLEFRVEGGSRILSLDGGGIRGLIQIEILSEIERQTGKRITELFDWIIGTSTGGVIALGLVYCNKSLDDLRHIYFKLRQQVFANTRLGCAYNTAALEDLLRDELGTELRMSDVSHPKVLISAVDKATTHLQLQFFNNCFQDRFSTQPIWKVARYTSAAPMFFSEFENYVDGGVLANNPSDAGLTRIQRYYRECSQKLPIACVVSLGSGMYPAVELGNIDLHEGLRFGRQLVLVRQTLKRTQNLIELLTNALVESEAVAEKCRSTCAEQRIPFFRFSPQLDDKIEPGETDSMRLLDMIVKAKISTNQDTQMDRLVPLLLRVMVEGAEVQERLRSI